MTNRDLAFTNLFVSRIRKGQCTLEEVPTGILKYVKDKLRNSEEYKAREGECEETPTPPIDTGLSPDGPLIGNTQTQILHTYNCSTLPAERNQVQFECFSSVKEAVAKGFRACKVCNPKV